MQTHLFPNCTLDKSYVCALLSYKKMPHTCVTGEVHLNHHLQDVTEIQKIEQIAKTFLFL